MSAFEPRVVNTDDEDVTVWDFANGDNHIRRLLGSDHTAGRLSFFESVLAPGFVVKAHVHRDEDEYWYMLDPGIEVQLGTHRRPIAPGSIVAIPAGTIHEVANIGTEKARSLFFTMPGGLEDFFTGLADLARAKAPPEQFAALFERTGTSFPRPPHS